MLGAAVTSPMASRAAFGLVPGLEQAATDRPNIIYLNSHDTGRFTSPYGHPAPTPNLAQLAADGICFTQAHSAAPTCSPSRACLLTGQCAHRNGMIGLEHRGFRLNRPQDHLLQTLRAAAGYQSILVGLQHVARTPATLGYDRVIPVPSRRAEDVAVAAVDFLRQSPRAPFYLEVGFFETHRPYRRIADQSKWNHVLPPPPAPNVPATRHDMAEFYASAAALDQAVGQILAALEKAGMASNTLVISTTDHGIAFPKMKCNLYDTGTGVHLVMRGPGGFAGGKTCDALISQLDIFPTLCELLKIEIPRRLEGKSFLPVIRGEKTSINEAVFAEVNFHAAYEPIRSVRTARWKYIRRYANDGKPILSNCDDGLTKSYWLEQGWADQPVPDEELYDLAFDPAERNNLIASVTSAVPAREMRMRLRRWMESTQDPLLQGPVLPPPGARVNPRDSRSPTLADDGAAA
jgi:N-sulfoglucosamine sulfohydrolase